MVFVTQGCSTSPARQEAGNRAQPGARRDAALLIPRPVAAPSRQPRDVLGGGADGGADDGAQRRAPDLAAARAAAVVARAVVSMAIPAVGRRPAAGAAEGEDAARPADGGGLAAAARGAAGAAHARAREDGARGAARGRAAGAAAAAGAGHDGVVAVVPGVGDGMAAAGEDGLWHCAGGVESWR